MHIDFSHVSLLPSVSFDTHPKSHDAWSYGIYKDKWSMDFGDEVEWGILFLASPTAASINFPGVRRGIWFLI